MKANVLAWLFMLCMITVVVRGQESEFWKGPTENEAVESITYGDAAIQSQIHAGLLHPNFVLQDGRVSVSGAAAEYSFSDQSKRYASNKRWSLYANAGNLNTYRDNILGGFSIAATGSATFHADLNVVNGRLRVVKLQLDSTGSDTADSTDKYTKKKCESTNPTNSPDDCYPGDRIIIGDGDGKHLRMGYGAGHVWIQSSINTNLHIMPGGNSAVAINRLDAKANLHVGGHIHVSNNVYVTDTMLSETDLRFSQGSGWYMSDSKFIRVVNPVPVFTQGKMEFMGNVGIGCIPKYPIFRLQVHTDVKDETGAVYVTDSSDRGFLQFQDAEGFNTKAINVATEKEELMLIEASPLLINPSSGKVNIGTTVSKKDMHFHIKGNMYVHGHMFAMKNLHVRDHAKVGPLSIPNLALKNEPQSADGDTLTLGHTAEKGEANSIVGINIRMGFKDAYTWIQVHGKKKGEHAPLALNPLGNSVMIGTDEIELIPKYGSQRLYNFWVSGNSYVNGELSICIHSSDCGAPSEWGVSWGNPALTKDSSGTAAKTETRQIMTEHVALNLLHATSFVIAGKESIDTSSNIQGAPGQRLLFKSIHADMYGKGNQGIETGKTLQIIHKVLNSQTKTMDDQEMLLIKHHESILQLKSRLASLRK